MPQTVKDTQEVLGAEAILIVDFTHRKGWSHQSTIHGLLEAIFNLPAGRLLGATSGQV